ncbi:MAG: TmcC family electron transfer complex membrane anchor subunit [Desulfobacterales bacterium]
MDVYELVRGPFAWIALAIFALGSLYRIIFLLLRGKKESTPNYSKGAKDAARSVLHGLLPFGSTTMRKQPLFTTVTFLFHLCVIILPIFLLAHIVLWYESWKILWLSLPDMLADAMALWVMLACLYFMGRRLVVPEVRKVSRPGDVVLLIIILLTFLSGFLSHHQWGPYRPILILHVILSEVLLVTLPFSKLGHMLFFYFSRAYTGAEYGKTLKARDW